MWTLLCCTVVLVVSPAFAQQSRQWGNNGYGSSYPSNNGYGGSFSSNSWFTSSSSYNIGYGGSVPSNNLYGSSFSYGYGGSVPFNNGYGGSVPFNNGYGGSVPFNNGYGGSVPFNNGYGGSVPFNNGYGGPVPFNNGYQNSDDITYRPIFDFQPSGVRVLLPGTYEESNMYLIKYYMSINQELDMGIGQKTTLPQGRILRYSGERIVPRGSAISFTVPTLTVQPGDILYYLITVQSDRATRTQRGYRQITSTEETQEPSIQDRMYNTYPTNPPTILSRLTEAQTYPTKATPPTQTYPTTHSTTPQYTTRPTTTTTTERPEACKQSTTTYNSGTRLCVGSLLDQNIIFNSVEQIAGVEPEESFTVFLKDNVVSNGSKYKSITTSLLEEKYGNQIRVGNQSLTLQSCTSKNPAQCSAKATGYFILPPVLSGRQTTEDDLYFRYGILEVTAKLPSGDWVVPELWLLPKNRKYDRDSGKIVLAKSRGNAQLYGGAEDYGAHVLEAGVQIGSDNHTLYRKTQDRPWSDEYHTFRLDWTPDELVFYVDNNLIGRTTPGSNRLDSSLNGTKLAPFDQEFFLVFGIHVGGDQDFPNSIVGKPWKNLEPKNKLNFWKHKSKWHPIWSQDTALHIRDIKLTALDY